MSRAKRGLSCRRRGKTRRVVEAVRGGWAKPKARRAPLSDNRANARCRAAAFVVKTSAMRQRAKSKTRKETKTAHYAQLAILHTAKWDKKSRKQPPIQPTVGTLVHIRGEYSLYRHFIFALFGVFFGEFNRPPTPLKRETRQRSADPYTKGQLAPAPKVS